MDPRLRHLGTAVLLVVALLGVAITAFIPHLGFKFNEKETPIDVGVAAYEWVTGAREGYMHPVHGDELRLWVHAADLQRGDVRYETIHLRSVVHELGFVMLWAYVQAMTGVDGEELIVYLPAMWSTFIAFALFATLRPHPCATLAALAFVLAPTTPRFLGMGFFVPIGFVLPWALAAIILESRARRDPWSAIALTGVVGWSFFVHLIGGFAVIAAILLLAGRRGWRREKWWWTPLAATAFLVIVSLAFFSDDIASELGRQESREGQMRLDSTVFFEDFGWAALGLWFIGTIALLVRPPSGAGEEAWVLAAASVVCVVLIVYTRFFNPGLYATYDRWHVPFFFVACASVGYALWLSGAVVVRSLASVSDRFRPAAPILACLVVAGFFIVAAWPSVTAHADVNYARPFAEKDIEAAAWYRDNMGPHYPAYGAQRDIGYLIEAWTGRQPSFTADRVTTEEIAAAPVEVLVRLNAPGFDAVGPGVFARTNP